MGDVLQRRRGDEDFMVLSTYVKYIMWEDYSELIKLRHIRTLRNIRRLEIDRYPYAGVAGHEEKRLVQNFYSLPGTASQKSKFFVVDLPPGDEFLAHHEYSFVFGYTVPEPLSVTHPDENEEGIDIGAPLGSRRVALEVHLPKSRRFGEEEEVKVFAYYSKDNKEERVSPKDYEVDIEQAFMNTDVSRGTDVLRLTMRPPKDVSEIRVRWPWKRVSGNALPSLEGANSVARSAAKSNTAEPTPPPDGRASPPAR
jgi:hypothetical protein